MEKPGFLDWVIAPLTWLERARGGSVWGSSSFMR